MLYATLISFWKNIHLGHHEVPGQGDGVSPLLCGVVLPERVLEELLHVGLGLLLVNGGKDDGGDLERKENLSIPVYV